MGVLRAPSLTGLILAGCALIAVFVIASSRREPSVTTAPGNSTEPIEFTHLPLLPIEYPWGGRTLNGTHRLVGLYGAPGIPALGVLGEQSPSKSASRVTRLAQEYQKYTDQTVVPMFEIITTIASATATEDGDYSQELPIADIEPWITSAAEHDVYVVLDFQPGRESFVEQMKAYRSLLLYSHVGVALDPEWRLGPKEVHLQQIGSVDSSEVNAAAAWLASLVADHNLPQKVFMIHQFRESMLSNASRLKTDTNELAFMIQMDGQGTQAAKRDSYAVISGQAIPGVVYGWKNFYDEDTPVLSPQATMKLTPQPWFVSYQ